MSYEHMQSYPRIFGRIGEDAPIELWRSKTGLPVQQHDINQATKELSPCWSWWIERTTPVAHLVGDRPHIKNHNLTTGENRKSHLALSEREITELVESGVEASTPETP